MALIFCVIILLSTSRIVALNAANSSSFSFILEACNSLVSLTFVISVSICSILPLVSRLFLSCSAFPIKDLYVSILPVKLLISKLLLVISLVYNLLSLLASSRIFSQMD